MNAWPYLAFSAHALKFSAQLPGEKLPARIAKKARGLLHVARREVHLYPIVGEMLRPANKPRPDDGIVLSEGWSRAGRKSNPDPRPRHDDDNNNTPEGHP